MRAVFGQLWARLWSIKILITSSSKKKKKKKKLIAKSTQNPLKLAHVQINSIWAHNTAHKNSPKPITKTHYWWWMRNNWNWVKMGPLSQSPRYNARNTGTPILTSKSTPVNLWLVHKLTLICSAMMLIACSNCDLSTSCILFVTQHCLIKNRVINK